MAHQQQQDFCKRISETFPKYFKNKKVLDIGSLDINGNNKFFLTDCNYIGLDVGEGQNVDVVQVAHLYDAPNDQFDLIISTEVFEHDMYYEESVKNIIRMLKPGGAFIFTCASTGRPEHGTRQSDGGDAAPLLTQISEEWADYYKNLEQSDFTKISGFNEAFPDGIFEYNSYPGDLYFFGVKGGIANDQLYSEPEVDSLIIEEEYEDDIFVVDTWPNSPEKEADLIDCIKRLRQFKGIPILLVSHYAIKPEIQKLVDYYIFDKENPLLLHEDFPEHSVSSGRWTSLANYRVDNEMPYHHDYAIWRSMTLAFNFCNLLGKKMIHFMEYDNLIDTFQYRQAFLEKSKYHDAIIYEYHQGSSVDQHLGQYCATFIFSIKTDIALKMMEQVKSKAEYFMNRPEGWQLERVFLHYLRQFTNNIGMTEYIANDNELNTQAVWNRDGIFRDDAVFQIYPAVDEAGSLYLHLISGFHEQAADRDYLLETKFKGSVRFDTLVKNSYLLIDLGAYTKGETVTVNYLGKCVFSLFLQDDLFDFIQMNRLTKTGETNEPDAHYNFIDGAYIELSSTSNLPYTVKFKDRKTGVTDFTTSLKSGYWAKTDKTYFKDWKIEICDKFENVLFDIDYNAKDQRVFIVFESSALGDTLAWIPYVDEFRKKNQCKVICSTFWNDLFIESYPEIEFVKPGSQVSDLYALYRLGYFYNQDGTVNYSRVATDFKKNPLQHTASEILGLDYTELKPSIKQEKKTRLKRVGLGIHGTCQAKYWNNPEGWQKVVDWLLANDYEPIILSREEDGYMGNRYPVGATQLVSGSINSVVDSLNECSAFIGISSGLTWLSWATDTPTIQISGFTYEFNEPTSGIVKLSSPEGACGGCANRLKLDQGDWNWCPDQNGTARQFECSKLITAESVIHELQKILI